ncbi:hypothetical protein FACS189434_13460 [Bacteroidia bacterium]|nr:hypothetical protein FACS189434_13460 [Bacteroidia bacterium]
MKSYTKIRFQYVDNSPDVVEMNKKGAVSKDKYYTVKKGDTLSAIAVHFKVAVDELVKWNRIADPDKIEVGQRLMVGKVEKVPEANKNALLFNPPVSPKKYPSKITNRRAWQAIQRYDQEGGIPQFGVGREQLINLPHVKHPSNPVDMSWAKYSFGTNVTNTGQWLYRLAKKVMFFVSKIDVEQGDSVYVDLKKDSTYVVFSEKVHPTIISEPIIPDGVFSKSDWVLHKSDYNEQSILRTRGTYNVHDTVDYYEKRHWSDGRTDSIFKKH